MPDPDDACPPQSQQEALEILQQSNRLREALLVTGLDKKELAQQIGKDNSTVAKWLNGGHRCPQLRRAADLLSVRYQWLMFGEGPMQASADDHRKKFLEGISVLQGDLPESSTVQVTVGNEEITITRKKSSD